MKDSPVQKTVNHKSAAFLGTGPLSLLKAYLLAKANPDLNITLFDSSSQIGGAWYTDKSPKGHEIECGCHIWSYVPKAYTFIENELGVKLYPWKKRPAFVGKNILLSYSIKKTIHSYSSFFKSMFTLNWKGIRDLSIAPEISYRIFYNKNLYPSLGSPELIHALEKKIASCKNITIKLNSKADFISIDEKISLVVNNQNYTFDKLYLTYVSQLNELTLYKKQIHPKKTEVNYIHLLLQLNAPLAKEISYWRFINDPVVHRITDISYQTRFEENLILVGIKSQAFDSAKLEKLTEHVVNLLKRSKLLNESHEIKLLKTHVFPVHYLDQKTIDELEQLTNKLEIIHSTDLMHGIHYLLRSETPHLIKTPK